MKAIPNYFNFQPQQIKNDSSNDIQAIDETNPSDRQKARARTYYYRNRDKIIRKQKEYQ